MYALICQRLYYHSTRVVSDEHHHGIQLDGKGRRLSVIHELLISEGYQGICLFSDSGLSTNGVMRPELLAVCCDPLDMVLCRTCIV